MNVLAHSELGMTPTPTRRIKRKRRQPVESDITSDEYSADVASTGIVKDITIEAIRNSGDEHAKMYLSTFEGHADLQCSWVSDSGMSKATKDWWLLARELRYPGYSGLDYPVYDQKENSLSRGASTTEFLSLLPLELLQSPTPEKTFTELVANPEFKVENFIDALVGEASLELFFLITETLVDSDRKIPVDEQASGSGIPPPPHVRRMRLIVSSSSSDDTGEEKKEYRYRGQPAYVVREIRNERIVRGRTEYHVFWKGYDSSEATWEPASNVNREAVNIWRAKRMRI